MTRITLKTASKCLSNGAILPDADIAWEGGRIYGIMAENPGNRADKIALIRLLCSEDAIEPKGAKAGALTKMPSFIPFLGAYGNLRASCAFCAVTREDILAAIEAVGLMPFLRERVGSYSPDMLTRLALARLLICNPSVIALDMAELYPDADAAELIRELLFAERACGKLIVIFSHLEEYLTSVCDEIHRVQGSVLRKCNG